MGDNNTKIVISAVDQATAVIGKIQASLGSLAGAVPGFGGAVSLGAIATLAKSSIDAADSLNDLSQKVGISIQNLAGWTLAANQSGTSMESVAKGIKGLSAYIHDNSDALEAAGITARDADGAMLQLADIFKAMPDGVEKTALAVKLFGKSGMDMIAMLNQGSEGLTEAKRKSEEYGRKMAELAPDADKFNDTLAELALNSKIVGINIAQHFIPGLIGLSQWLIDIKSNGEKAFEAISWMFGDTVARAAALHGFGGAGLKRSASGKIGGGGGLTPAEEEALGEKNAATLDAMRKAGILNPAGSGTAAGGDSALARMIAKGNANLAGTVDSEEEMRILAEKRAMADAKKEFEDLQRMLKKGEENELAAYYETAGEETMRMVSAQQELQRATKQTDNFARDMGMSFASAFEDAVIGGKSFSDVLRGLAQDIERIVLRKTITEPMGNAITDALKGSNIGSGGLFGSLKEMLGFANGGSFTVGGSGGTDSQIVAFRATPGEDVTIRTPGQQRGGSVVINQSISVDSRSDQASIVQAMVAAKNAAVAEIHSSMRRGGAFA